jgi:hypothetical protein
MDPYGNDNVWIDRQEYERLKTIESEATIASATSAPVVATDTGAGATQVKPAPKPFGVVTILTAITAVLSFIYPPLLLLFIVLGAVSFIKLIKSSAALPWKIGAVVVIALCLIPIAPILFIIPMFIMWQIGCWTGLGSCTTA